MTDDLKELKALFIGMYTVFKHLFKKPITLEYPEKRRELNDIFRGKPEVMGCIGCGICKKVCPAGAISYCKGNNEKIQSYEIDLKKCIFCGNCSFYCPKNAIKMTKKFELGSSNKNDLMLVYKGGEDD